MRIHQDPCETRPPAANPGAAGRAGASCAAAALLLILAGCVNERIRWHEYEQIEQAVAAAQVTSQPALRADFKPYTVARGDVLEVHMMGLEASQTNILRLRVDRDGSVNLPLAGKLPVADQELDRVEQAIVDALVPRYLKNLSVFVDVVSPEGATVLVVGGASKQGLVTLPSNQRDVLHALSAAGVLAIEDVRRVRVRSGRADRAEVEYDLGNPDDIRRAMSAPPLVSGDLITVEPAEASVIYVTGVVNQQGPIAVPRDSTLSLQKAIAAAGGIRDYLTVRDATLVRTLADGRRVRVELPIEKILTGQMDDIELAAGDVLQIPHTFDTLVQEWFVRNVVAGPFSVSLKYDPLAQYNANRAIDADSGSVRDAIRQSLGSTVPGIVVPSP